MEEGKKTPAVVIENPLSDEEITRDEAPMVERENPAFTSNGGENQNMCTDAILQKLVYRFYYHLVVL